MPPSRIATISSVSPAAHARQRLSILARLSSPAMVCTPYQPFGTILPWRRLLIPGMPLAQVADMPGSRMDTVIKSLKRISKELPNLSKKELELVENCLEDCFETGRTWDSIPILVHKPKRHRGLEGNRLAANRNGRQPSITMRPTAQRRDGLNSESGCSPATVSALKHVSHRETSTNMHGASVTVSVRGMPNVFTNSPANTQRAATVLPGPHYFSLSTF